MLSSMYSGISGLKSNSDALNVVGNNISNVNTTGYKSSTALFEDVLYQTISSTSGAGQVGRGSALSAVTTNFSQGSFETTSSALDLAIGGSGFFIVKKSNSQGATEYYTRAGAFSLDKDGYLTDPAGDYVQGWQVGGTGSPVSIRILQEPSQPKASEAINLRVQLDSTSAWKGSVIVDGAQPDSGLTAVGVSGTPPAGNYRLTISEDGTSATLDLLDIDGNVATSYQGAPSSGAVTDFGGSGLDLTFGTVTAGGASTFAVTVDDADPANPIYAAPLDPPAVTSGLTNAAASEGKYPVTGIYTLVLADNGSGGFTGTLTIGDDTYTDTIVGDGTVEDFGGSGLNLNFESATAGTSTFAVKGFDDPAATTTASANLNYSTSLAIYDSQGVAHDVTISFRKASINDDGSSIWEYQVTATGSKEVENGTGTLRFMANGIMDTAHGTSIEPVFSWSNGAPDQMVTVELNSSAGPSTQYASACATNSQGQDGYPMGVLQSVAVSQEGIISGNYDNGQILQLWQLTLASFNNPQGLRREGGNLYSTTLESGNRVWAKPGELGLGKISANSLEQSNVDLATEFVKMIVAQRGYEANSKVITTTDEVLQSLMNLKR